jgi:hypothetical protein
VLLVLLGIVVTPLALGAGQHDHHPVLFFRHLCPMPDLGPT